MMSCKSPPLKVGRLIQLWYWSFTISRRKQAQTAQPNQAHILLAQLEQQYEVVIITQNVDNLHEKAGSSQVIHLHGELFKSQSTLDPRLVYDMDALGTQTW